MNIATIKTALYTWAANNSSGMTVVWSDQAAPRPARPYATLKIRGHYAAQGTDELRPNSTTGIIQVLGHRKLVVSVQVFGDSIEQKAHDLIFSLSKPSVLTLLRASNISVSNVGDVLNVTRYQETKFEEVFNCDFDIYVVAIVDDNSGYFDSTEISGLGETQIIEA